VHALTLITKRAKPC